MPSGDKRPQIVVLSSIEWNAAWQRHQVFASQWAEAGYEVFFVENTASRNVHWRDLPRLKRKLWKQFAPDEKPPSSRTSSRLVVLNPFVLPPTAAAFRRLNALCFVPRLVRQLRAFGLRERPLVIAYLPTRTTLEILDHLNPIKVVYDCVDNFQGLASAPPDLARTEKELLSRSALVVTTSPTLFADKADRHTNVIELHQGVPRAFFLDQPLRGEYKRLCYYGTLWRALDYAPIRALADAGYEVTLIGPQKDPLPPLPPNVRIEPPLRYEDIPGALRHFDALLLPYDARSSYNRGVVPAKFYECLATGCPVIASPLPALRDRDDVLYLAEHPEDWPRIVSELPKTETAVRRQRRLKRATAHEHSLVFSRLRSEVEAASAASGPGVVLHASEVVSGLTSIGVLYGLARGSTLLTQVLAGRWLGPQEYGKANVAIAGAAYLQILPIMGFPIAMSKFVSCARSDAERDDLIATTLTAFSIWATAWLAIIVALRAVIAARLSMPLPLFEDSLLFAFLTAFYTVVSSPLLGLRRFAHRGLAEAIYGLSAPVALLVFLVRGGSDYRVLITSLCVSLILGSSYSLWLLRDKIRPRASSAALRVIAEYALIAALNLLATACILAPARLLLHRYDSAQAVGVFSAYFTATVQVALALVYMAASVMIPLTSDAARQRDAWRLFRRWGAATAGVAWMTFAVLATVAMQVFGNRYPFKATWALLFAMAATLILVHGIVSSLFAARDRRGLYISAAANSIAGGANIVLARELIPNWGVMGAGAALVLAYIAGFLPFATTLFRRALEAPARRKSYNLL